MLRVFLGNDTSENQGWFRQRKTRLPLIQKLHRSNFFPSETYGVSFSLYIVFFSMKTYMTSVGTNLRKFLAGKR